MAKRTFQAGATSQTIDVFIQDTSQTNGTGLTGLAFNTSGLTAYYRAGGQGASTVIALATQTATGAWSSGGFCAVDATNMPGVYRFDVPNTVLAASPYAIIYFQGATNMAPVVAEIELFAYNPFNAQLGLAVDGNGNLKADVEDWKGSAAPAMTGDAFARLGAPAGASVSADVAAVKAEFPANFPALAVDSGGNVAIQSNLKKNTAFANFMFVMTDATTGAPSTGLTVTATRALDGGAFAGCANAVSEIANGWYVINLAATDTNANRIALRFTASGANDTDIEINTQP